MILEVILNGIVEILRKVKKVFLNRHFIKFCLFGIINTLDTAIFSALFTLLGVGDTPAALLGYIFSLQIAFFLTCKFIFRVGPTFLKYKRFIFSYLPSFIVYAMLHGAMGNFELNQFVKALVAVMLSGPLTFFIVKIYAFEKDSKKKDK